MVVDSIQIWGKCNKKNQNQNHTFSLLSMLTITTHSSFSSSVFPSELQNVTIKLRPGEQEEAFDE